MLLTQLSDLNAQVQNQLKAARLPMNTLEVCVFRLPTMDLVKSDHSAISASIPVHRFNISRDDKGLSSTSDYANAVVRFVLDAANEFTHPRIDITKAYVNYNPRMLLSDWVVVSFNIAIWEYDGQELRWLEMPSDPNHKGHSFGLDISPPLQIAVQKHQLLKTEPFEVNIWTSNIARDIAQTSKNGGSTLRYMVKLEQDLLNGARAAAESLHKMQRAASVHDVVAALFRKAEFSQAATVLSEALKVEVSLAINDSQTVLVIDDRMYCADQVFTLVAGLPTEGVDCEEKTDFWKYSEPDEKTFAKIQALGLNINTGL